jgi:hypothetical protein
MTRHPPGRRTDRLSRRAFLAAGAAATGALAGCIGGDDEDGNGNGGNETNGDEGDGEPSSPDVVNSSNAPTTPSVEDPPDAVYLPTHQESMEHLGTVEAGEYAVMPMLTYPHKFWLVSGTEREAVTPDSTGVHLMATVWDAETGEVLPVDTGAQLRLTRDGDLVDQRAPWPMISQTMGFHFGDNVPLPEQGTYAVEFDLTPIGGDTVRKTGEFADRFTEPRTVRFEFEFDQEFQESVVNGVEYLDEDRWGEPGALDPMAGMGGMDDNGGDSGGMDDEGEDDGNGGMEMGMPFSDLQPADAYPGEDLGTPTSGDATFVVRYLEETRLSEDSGYLLVSPRTPYNRVPLADMALSVEGALEGELVQTLDSEVGHHYGIAGDLASGEQLDLVVESPPQVARHRGYETAFLEMPPMGVEVP